MARSKVTAAQLDDETIARGLVAALGGRFSAEAGIDVDAGAEQVERWFLAATLFGARITATIAMRTYTVLDAAGVSIISESLPDRSP